MSDEPQLDASVIDSGLDWLQRAYTEAVNANRNLQMARLIALRDLKLDEKKLAQVQDDMADAERRQQSMYEHVRVVVREIQRQVALFVKLAEGKGTAKSGATRAFIALLREIEKNFNELVKLGKNQRDSEANVAQASVTMVAEYYEKFSKMIRAARLECAVAGQLPTFISYFERARQIEDDVLEQKNPTSRWVATISFLGIADELEELLALVPIDRPEPGPAKPTTRGPKVKLRDAELEALKAVEAANGNVSEAARKMGKGLTTVRKQYKKALEKLGNQPMFPGLL